MGERYQRLVRVLELVRVEERLPYPRGWRGRTLEDRAALARAFLAKAVLDVVTTRALVERLRNEATLRRLCGWEKACSTFTRVPARMLAEPPLAALDARVLQTLSSKIRPGCYQPERQLLGGTRTRRKKAPFHGALCLRG